MNIMKKEKGVTIVALTVTVIMLIVLAGITINAVVGDNGILKTAEQTKENVEKSKVDVQTRLNEVYSTTRQSTNITYHSTEADELKQKIAEALTLKGVQTSPDEGADAMAKKILDLETTVDMEAITEATAKKAEILSGKTAWVNGEKLTGAMPNFSSNIQTVNAAASNATTEVDITDGFHTKIKVNGKPAYDAGVTAGTAAGTAAAKVGTATAGDVLAGKTFTNSSKIGETGTMATLTKDNFTGAHSSTTAGAASNYTVTSSKAGYVPSGTQVNSIAATTSDKINTTGATGEQTINIKPGYYNKIKVDQTAAYNAGNTAGVNATKVGTAAAGDVLAGKTFTNSSKVGETGTMKNFSSNIQTVNAPASNATTEVDITDGFHTKIKVNGKPAYDAGVTAGTAAGTAAAKVGTAAAGDVLAGKTFTNSSKVGETGTMATLTKDNFTGAHSSATAGAASNYTVTSSKAGYVPSGTQVNSIAATTSDKISTTAGTGEETINIKPGYYNKIKVDRTAAYNAGNTAGVNATKVGTAGAADVLAGKTFTNSSKVGETGTMATLTSENFAAAHSSETAGEASNYTVTSSKAGYVPSGTQVNSIAATTSPTIETTGATGTKTINIKPGYYNKISVNQTAAYNAGNTAGVNATKVGTAGAADVLAGKTFTNSSKVGETGTMATLTSENFATEHSSETAGEASNYTVTSSKAGYVPNGTQVASLAATTSPTIATTGETGTKTINIKPGYYNKISVNQTAAYNAGNTAGVNATKVGTAGAGDVLAGKTFTNSSKVGETGTMVDNGAVTGSVGVGGTYKIDAGYHNGSGKVTGPTLSGTAAETDVLSGKTFYSNSGTKLTGKIEQRTNGTATKIALYNNTTSGVKYMHVNGFETGYYYTPDGNTWAPEIRFDPALLGAATQAQVLKDKTFSSASGANIKGTMPSNALGTSVNSVGKDSKGPYAYIPYGFYPEYSGKKGYSYVYFTNDQAKKLANDAGVGYNAGAALGSKTTVKTIDKTTSSTKTYTLTADYRVLAIGCTYEGNGASISYSGSGTLVIPDTEYSWCTNATVVNAKKGDKITFAEKNTVTIYGWK